MAGQQRKRKPIEGSDRSGEPLDANKDGVLDMVQEIELADNPDAEPGMHLPEDQQFPSESEEQAEFDKGIEEFNNHVKALVKTFFQHEVAELEERITDLETLVGKKTFDPVIAFTQGGGQPVAGPPKDVGEPQYDVPDYSPAHQGGDGTEWYTG